MVTVATDNRLRNLRTWQKSSVRLFRELVRRSDKLAKCFPRDKVAERQYQTAIRLISQAEK